MNTLVTGATGFVGSRLATALLERGDHVRALVRDQKRAAALESRGVELVAGDMKDADALRRAAEGVECVYHSAAVVGDWLDREEARQVNVEGTRHLLAACAAAGVRRAVHVSSLSVLGTKHHHGTDESGAYIYGDPYTDTKIDSERVAREFGERGELETVCVRPGFVYGPGDHQLLPRLLEALATGQFLFIGDGSKEMNSIYIDDVADAALLAGTLPQAAGQVYNLTDDARTTVKEFVTYLCDSLQIPVPTRHLPVPIAKVGCAALESVARLVGAKKPPRLNRSRLRFLYYNQYYSIEKARRELGYAPRFTYREGLPPTLEWFRAEGLLPHSIAAAGSRASV
jgi:nucleoside-diphosphate-sugar epimerase